MHRDRLTNASWLVAQAARIANRLFLAAVLLAFLLTWLLARPFAVFLGRSNPGVDVPAEVIGLRLEMLIGIAAALATDRLLAALRDLLAAARAGDPFAAASAGRLATIGWALLALQLLDIPATLLGRFFPSLGSAAPGGGVSLGGWMAVLLTFVLSRAFATAAAMRDELAGTV